MSYPIHFESRLSLTGSKADERIRIAPGEVGSIVSQLAARLAKKAGVAVPNGSLDEAPIESGVLDRLAERPTHG